jgi:hypothetical protein
MERKITSSPEGRVVPIRARIRRLVGRPVRPRRGADRLVLDLVAVDRIVRPDRASARSRLEVELGRPLLAELDRVLELDGRVLDAPRRRRLGRAA